MKDLDAYATLVSGSPKNELFLKQYDLTWVPPQVLNMYVVDIPYKALEGYSRKRVPILPKVPHIRLFKELAASDPIDIPLLTRLFGEGYTPKEIAFLTGLPSRKLTYEWGKRGLRYEGDQVQA